MRDPHEIRRWHGWDYGGLDAEVEAIYVSEAVASEAERTLETGGTRFELEPDSGRAVLRVIMPAPAEDPLWGGDYEAMKHGWIAFVQQLRFALERHRGEDRRTLYLAGDPDTPDATGLQSALGLASLTDAPAGRRYATGTALGEDLAGEVWFRSEDQLALTVDTWGDGLLILSDRWVPGGKHGDRAALITTYGQDNASFERLRRSWTDWWQAGYSTRR